MSLEDRPPFSPNRRRIQQRTGAEQPIICGAIIAACFALYLWESTQPGGTFGDPIHPGLLYGPYVRNGQWWRLITYVFEHGGPVHLVLNMSVVLTVGTALERIEGHATFAVVSFVSAIGSAAAAMLLSYGSPVVGASGMILGWAGAILPLLNEQGRRSIGVWLVQVALIGFVFPRVSWQAHLGGFLFGLACGYALKRSRDLFWLLAPFLAIGAAGAALAATHSALHPG